METTSYRILLVEDHDDTARALTRLLSLSGYDVHTADSFASAIQLFDRHTFDLLISDVGLPDGTGYELMREARVRHGTSCGIAVSGYGTDKDIELSRQAGFAEHLVKPVQFDDLKQAISRVAIDPLNRPDPGTPSAFAL